VSSGSFTGSIATAVGSAVSDGKLQVGTTDTILATYFDVSHNSNHVALAVQDLLPPVLSGVSVPMSLASRRFLELKRISTSWSFTARNNRLPVWTLTGTAQWVDTAHSVV